MGCCGPSAVRALAEANLIMIIAQITDMHVGKTLEGPEGPLDTFACLERAIDHLNAIEPGLDAVLVTGDLTNGAEPSDYARLKAALARLAAPSYVIPGNHDDRDRMLAALLFGTTGVAMLLLLAPGLNLPALLDVALVFALLAAVALVAFVRRAWNPPTDEERSHAP